MAEEARDSESPNEAAHDIESQIKGAMRSRVAHFKEQADSLTFEGVRRLLEKDLGLETYALDVHKRLIKQCLQECLDGADDDNASKTFGEMGEKGFLRGEVTEASDGLHLKKDVNDSEDSPVMGLLTGHKTTKPGTKENEVSGNNEAPSESTIKKAIRKRASYVKANSEEVTMAGLRRLLEGDLKLEKYTLDPYKKFISQQLDEVLQSHEVSEDKQPVNVKKNVLSKASKKVSSEESSDSSDSKGDVEEEEEEEEVKPRKKSIPKGKMQKSDLTKRKKPAKETNVSNKKRRKAGETISEDNSDAEDSGHVSEDDHSQSSPEKSVKKKEVSNIAYGKRVEHLKSIIKSCGMSVPPSIYKKVKQVPENKREAHLIKELEEILSKEGLSANPSEKEIKDVRKKKERAKELEGIDMSNIVQSSRRRSAISFVAPPKPKMPVESEGDDAEDTDKDNDVDADDADDDDDADNNDDEDDDDDEEDDDGSQSEDFNDDADEDSD